jgi:hypothetical protein
MPAVLEHTRPGSQGHPLGGQASRTPWRRLGLYPLVSLLVLIPCFWQSRIQAGDLASHIYNAWLAQLIEHGQAPGLSLVRQSNNVLFDGLLSTGLQWVGAAAAQRIAVALAVLVFFWGSFAFVWSGRRSRSAPPPWHVGICLAMLAYGWVFHMGLFNFYLSLGLCFAAIALARQRTLGSGAAAFAVLVLAYTAHALPVGWCIGFLVYERVAGLLRPRYRLLLFGAGLAGLALIAWLLCARFGGAWAAGQVMAVSGADQVWVYGNHYIPFSVALLAVWMLWFERLLDTRGAERLLLDTRFQLCLLCAASVLIIPGTVLLPGMRHTLNVMAERMSLATAVIFCGLAATVRPRRGEVAALAVIAVLFFACTYSDEHALNQVESQMAALVAQLPPGQRVVSVLAEPNTRINSLAHLIDRVCVGRCYSYANYEPSTAQFRVRADRPNPIVVWNYSQSWHIQAGGYVVQPRDLPLYNIDRCRPGSRQLCIAPLRAGVTLHNTWLRVGPVFGKWDNRHE